MCRGGELEELAAAAQWIRALPHRIKIVVAGNHDWAFVHAPDEARRLLGEDILYLQDAAAEVGGLRVWGSPWQPEYCDWAFNLPRGKALADVWAKIPEGLDLLVTHGPPEGMGDRSSSGPGRHGCRDLRERVRAARPRVISDAEIRRSAERRMPSAASGASGRTCIGPSPMTAVSRAVSPRTGGVRLSPALDRVAGANQAVGMRTPEIEQTLRRARKGPAQPAASGPSLASGELPLLGPPELPPHETHRTSRVAHLRARRRLVARLRVIGLHPLEQRGWSSAAVRGS
jgi:hypothetical protein